MTLKELSNKSYYGTIGYVEDQSSIDMIERFINHNLSNLKLFKGIIVATNYKEYSDELALRLQDMWESYLSNVVCLHSKVNRGNAFGTADLDDMVVDYCIENKLGWLCKSANDMVITFDPDKEVGDADFYYMNGIGYGGMVKYDFDISRIVQEDFYPQTNFYYIDTSKIPNLNDKDHINEVYNKISEDPNYSGKAWEYGFRSCETLLAERVTEQELKKEHLISLKRYEKLLNLVIDRQIHDPSHKNILIEGICHLQYPDEKVVII